MTRLSNTIFKSFSISTNAQHRQKAFYMLAALLVGFLSGALFGTVLPFLRALFLWDGFVIAALLLFIECLSYMSYRPSHTSLRFALISSRSGLGKVSRSEVTARSSNFLQLFKKYRWPTLSDKALSSISQWRQIFFNNPVTSSSRVPYSPKKVKWAMPESPKTSNPIRGKFCSRKTSQNLFSGKAFYQSNKKRSWYFTRKGLSFYKIGVMIGFFVDAFKVGS